MYTRYIPTTVLAILASSFLATAGSFQTGPGITASDLASQLGINAASMIYQQDTPFSKLTVGLRYKERTSAGKFEEKQSLLYTTYTLPQSTTKQEIKVLFSQDGSTVIVGTNKSHGKGINLPPPNTLMNPPALMKDGTYALMFLYSDPKDTAEEDIKGVLELIVIAAE
jgi:hypothetical protein